MDLGIKGKRALVTGAGRGIGKAIVQALASEGVLVGLVSRTESDVQALLDEIGGKSIGHFGVALDLVQNNGPSRLVELMNKSKFGPIDIIVHNLGGTLDITDPFCSIEDWRKVLRFNLEIAIELNGLLVPNMITRKWGRIVHISSISGSENHGPITYCSAKAALNAYTRSFGRVLAPNGIAVSTVLPGAFFTEGGYWDIALKNNPEHVEKYLKERMAIHRFGKLDEVSNLVAFLCSEHAGFCVGSIIPVDGGQGRTFSF